MINNGKHRRVLGIFLSAVLFFAAALPVMPATAYASSSFYDISGHWAEGYIKDIVSKGIVDGYKDDTFKPDKLVTRAEFISMLNNTLENYSSESVYFSDVPYNSWYYDDICKAIAAGYVSGYSDDSFKPNSPITREEAAVMISRIIPASGIKNGLKGAKDTKSISSWAKLPMQRVCGKGYLGVYDDGLLHPDKFMTRAQTAKIICAIRSSEKIETSTEKIKASSTKLSNTIYSNGVTISDDLGDGKAAISNCIILGTLTINGGGIDTITLENSRVANCKIDKENTPVQLLVSGESVIGETDVENKAIIVANKLSGDVFGTGFEKINLKSNADLSLKGNFNEVNVVGDDAVLRYESGQLKTLNITNGSNDSCINYEKKATIDTANVNGATAFLGKGIINNMIINTSQSVTYETKPKNWSLGSNGGAPTPGDTELTVAFSPDRGADEISLNSTITLTFNTEVYNIDGKTISAADVLSGVQIHKKSSSGTNVTYSAIVGSSKKIVTLKPQVNLLDDTKYYIKILDGYFRNSEGKYLEDETSYFTTGDELEGLVTAFKPENGASGISIGTEPTIVFSEKVQTYTGKSLSRSFIEDNIVLREGSASGTKVEFKATISSNETKITLDPSSNLKENTVYYIGVPAKRFMTQAKVLIPAGSSTWTTGSIQPVITGISGTATENTASLTVTPNIAGTIYASILTTGAAAPTADQITAGKSIAATGGSVTLVGTFSGLTAGTNYTMYAILKSPMATSSVASCSVTTSAPTVQSTLGAISVSGSSSFSPTFSESMASYTVVMPAGTTSASINVIPASDAAISYKLGSDAYTSATGNTIDVTLNTGAATVVVIKSAAAGKNAMEYTLSITVQ